MKKDLIENLIGFALSDYYKQWKPYLLRFLKISREPSTISSPLKSLALQLAILRNLSKLEISIREQQKVHGMQKTDRQLFYMQRLRHIFKDIADGLAWRLLGFNRPLMRILSQNRSSGFLDTEISKEDDVATRVVAFGHHVLIHDITNILRVGDLTVLEDKGYPVILEIKGSGRKVWTAGDYRNLIKRGGDLSTQARRVVEVDEAIRFEKISLGECEANLGVLDIPVETYLDTLDYVIKGCHKDGYCGRFVDRMMYVSAIKTDTATKLKLPFKLSKDWVHFTSMDTLYLEGAEPIRNKVPYTVLPLFDENIIQLVSGEVIIDSFLNLMALKKRFEQNGWKVSLRRLNQEASRERSRKLRSESFKGNRLFNKHVETTLYVLSKDGFHLEIPGEWVGLVYLDLLKPDFICNTAKFMKDFTESSRQEGYWSTAFSAERHIWR